MPDNKKCQFLLSDKGEKRVNLCPACGGFVTFDEYNRKKRVLCANCGLSSLLYRTVDEAVQEWNRVTTV